MRFAAGNEQVAVKCSEVWLLLAFTALASNVEAEAVPDYIRDDAGVGYLCGYRDEVKQGRGPKTELSWEQNITLQCMYDYLRIQIYLSVTGDFTFNGQRIPVDFIVTAAYIDRKLISDITVEDLWEKIQLYEYYEKKAESEPRTRDISKYEHVTALFIKTCVQNRGSTTGRVYMEGETAELKRVFRTSSQIKNATTSNIIKKIKTNPTKYKNPETIYPFYAEAYVKNQLPVILNYLRSQGFNATGTFVLRGHRISLQFIEWNLVQHGSVYKITTNTLLYRIITSYVSETEEFNGLPKKEKAVLRDILNYLKFLGDGAIGEVKFKSHTLSIDFIMTVVHLQGIDIYSLEVSELWELMKMYELYEKKLGSETQNRNISKNEQVTLLYAITYLRNNIRITGQIVIDGVKIPVSYLLNQLKIFGKDFRTATIEQLYITLSACLRKYTPPTRVPLGTQPTEEQTLELTALIDFMKTQRSPAVGSFIFSGYRTSTQFILSYMDQHGLRIDRLSSKELWSIMLLHECNETNKTTAVIAGPDSGISTKTTKTKKRRPLLPLP
ncbi:uncharacterized protein LOC111871585 [Cryptotermes secundus]|uniref:uncharacterized protein LOC111871585 n=1 Tax=Cryptotermes secundus TaxID=105785 RepID=UPI000CD7B86A|nr:uncharacterized protein LOC111871585 [Cryptotermes secundus]